jgi:hypothetical protein
MDKLTTRFAVPLFALFSFYDFSRCPFPCFFLSRESSPDLSLYPRLDFPPALLSPLLTTLSCLVGVRQDDEVTINYPRS